MRLISYYFFDDGLYARQNLKAFLSSPPLPDSYYIFYGVDVDLSRIVYKSWPAFNQYECEVVENKLFDFQGFKLSIKRFLSNKNFEYLFILNSTAAGPFVPSQVKLEWTQNFIGLISDDNVGLVGSTISVLDGNRLEGQHFKAKTGITWPVYPHVQSFCMCLTRKCVERLHESQFFDEIPKNISTRLDAIALYEINLSVRLLLMGFKLRCLIPGTDVCLVGQALQLGKNLRTPHCDFGLRNAYFGRDISPYEAIFIKTRRSANPHTILRTFHISGASE